MHRGRFAAVFGLVSLRKFKVGLKGNPPAYAVTGACSVQAWHFVFVQECLSSMPLEIDVKHKCSSDVSTPAISSLMVGLTWVLS